MYAVVRTGGKQYRVTKDEVLKVESIAGEVGSKVDFEVLMQRNAMYRNQECQSYKQFDEHKEEEMAELRAELAARQEEERKMQAELDAKEKHYV